MSIDAEAQVEQDYPDFSWLLSQRYKTIELSDPRPGVLQITLNRPNQRNAVNRLMHAELARVLFELRSAKDVGAVVLTGAGTAFCAGGDFDLIRDFQNEDFRKTARFMDHAVGLARDLLAVVPPIVAAVNGAGYGLGATLPLMCDYAVMAENAKLADTHVRIGVVAGDGGTLLWPAIMGHIRAKEFLLTGDPIDAATAQQLGLVNRVVPQADVLPTALDFAERMASGPRTAIAFTKQAINAQLLQAASQQVPLSIGLEARTFGMADHLEGLKAYEEGRSPVWPGTLPEPN